MIEVLLIVLFTITIVLIISIASPILIKLFEKKYLTQKYTKLVHTISKIPICTFKYYVSHSKVIGHMSAEGRKAPQLFDTQFKIILYEKFLIITTCGIAEKINYNEFVEYAETNWLGYYYGNIIIHKNKDIYNIVISKNKEDFDTIKNIIETYKGKH